MDTDVHRSLVWLKETGAELVEVKLARGRLSATGSAIGADPVPYRLEYILVTGDDYTTSSLRVHTSGVGWGRTLELRRDGGGTWQVLADADGHLDAPPPGGDHTLCQDALDCDLALSPLTNTMPVLRHGLLDVRDPVDFHVVWVSVPDLAVHRSAQRYTPVSKSDDVSVVRYEDDDFSADIVFDRDGLVVDYPGLARRVGQPPGTAARSARTSD